MEVPSASNLNIWLLFILPSLHRNPWGAVWGFSRCHGCVCYSSKWKMSSKFGKKSSRVSGSKNETTVLRLSEYIWQCTESALVVPVDFSATAHHIQLLDTMECGYFDNIKLCHNVFFRANDVQQWSARQANRRSCSHLQEHWNHLEHCSACGVWKSLAKVPLVPGSCAISAVWLGGRFTNCRAAGTVFMDEWNLFACPHSTFLIWNKLYAGGVTGLADGWSPSLSRAGCCVGKMLPLFVDRQWHRASLSCWLCSVLSFVFWLK